MRRRIEALESGRAHCPETIMLTDDEREAALTKMREKPGGNIVASCAREMLCRIKALEANHPTILKLRSRVEALWEEMRDRTDTLAAADGDTTSLIFKVTNRIEALERSATTPEPHAASAEARPAGGLVERVRRVIGDDAPCSHSNARAAIREVAAWLEARGNRGSAAELRQEADRG